MEYFIVLVKINNRNEIEKCLHILLYYFSGHLFKDSTKLNTNTKVIIQANNPGI